MYNVDFQIYSIIAIVFVLVYSLIVQYKRAEGNKRFIFFVVVTLVATILDTGTALIFDYCPNFPIRLNKIINSIYFFIATSSSYAFYDYVDYYLKTRPEKSRRINRRLNRILLGCFAVAFIVNYFTGIIFYFDENGYQHGPFFLICYFSIIYYVVNISPLTIIYHKSFTRLQSISVFLFITLEMGGSIVQAFFLPNVLLMYAAASLAIIMFAFTLETPDYRKLMQTMEELEETKKEAQAANKAKSAFLTNISHEIRRPINGILGMNTMILEETKEDNIKEYADSVDNLGKSLLATINDVLDMTKIESGVLEIFERRYNLVKVISDCYNLVSMSANEKNLEVEIENDENLPMILIGDETRIHQIIANLLTNAVKYTPEGKVTLSLYQENVSGNSFDLKIVVKDTGIGIAEQNLEKIFDSFQRVDEEKNRDIKGSGVGLRIVKQLVTMMNGKISVDSVYGEGSEFKVLIPQKSVGDTKIGYFWDAYATLQDEDTISTGSFTAPNARILVVDDVPMNIRVIKGFLKKTGVLIDGADSGVEAIKLAEQNPYDIIFLDHLMPDMDGIQTLYRMKELPGWINEGVPVIALTANTSNGAREEYLTAGFEEYLTKPVNDKQLAKLLVDFLPPDEIKWNGEASSVNSVVVVDKGKITGRNSGDNENLSGDDKLKNRFPMLNTSKGMEYCGGSEEIYIGLISDFKESDFSKKLSGAYQKEDWEDYRINVHALKSTSSTLGAENLSALAEKLENAAKDMDVDTLRGEHDSLINIYENLITELKGCFDE